MWYIYHGILLSHQKEWNNTICNNMDGFSIWNLLPPGNCLCDRGAGDSLCKWFRFWQWNAPPVPPAPLQTHTPSLERFPPCPQGFTLSVRVWVKSAVGVFCGLIFRRTPKLKHYSPLFFLFCFLEIRGKGRVEIDFLQRLRRQMKEGINICPG